MAGDPFLSDPSKKRKRSNRKTSVVPKTRTPVDEEISSGSDLENSASEDEAQFEKDDGDLLSEDEFQHEGAADKRRRLAKQYLENLKAQEIGNEDFDAADLDHDNLSRRLQEDVAETKGYVYKFYSDVIESQLQDADVKQVRIGSKNVTGVCVKYPYIYTVSKDMELIKWQHSGKKPQRVKHSKGGPKFFDLNTANPSANHHWDQINCVAASLDGKYVVTGGNDARLIIWSAENLSCLKVLNTREAVNAVTFRRGTDQLYAACADLRIRTYSINQYAQLEILYGHQDNITGISSLGRETCVSVGSRDKTAMFWKISEESRLTFRGGDAEKKKKKDTEEVKDEPVFFLEGSIDVVAMVDELHFVTGSDNGNVALWALSKKKPCFTERVAHGLVPEFTPQEASAELQEEKSKVQVPPPQPYWITAVYAFPYSDVFVTGSYSGEIKLWRMNRENFRRFTPLGSISVKGCVVSIDGAETDKKLVLYVATSKEHKLGRWLGKVEGRNALTVVTFNL